MVNVVVEHKCSYIAYNDDDVGYEDDMVKEYGFGDGGYELGSYRCDITGYGHGYGYGDYCGDGYLQGEDTQYLHYFDEPLKDDEAP